MGVEGGGKGVKGESLRGGSRKRKVRKRGEDEGNEKSREGFH